ncbi:hypothetical protein A3A38_03195 [Candidatus Kaiserbacteria bacterium RIFCSPLOWO2_01_FULL_53_17]|uniref:Uncharacterized protein n=1 Tax=Candidatus Kaiserbacteria bacterium RIFCSPLOWO2_01_FULL_53_17 TaxID=1798511 RepID=A0A1F6EG45_9BACT|nr:MAG: hypothetical protein A3A38_03195 [Candidatus Kaiserbacteria bacterium RIFCSPLOWO2_01_FULL_53_17]
MTIKIGAAGLTAWLFYESIGAGLINLAGIFLGIAQLLLDVTIEYTIVGFNRLISATVLQELNLVWTLFRDIANIVIIGMFTFIAISTILGSETFGARKMIAKVLVVAVLINFSLLFTRVIIESSNFVARHFYQAMLPQTAASAAASSQSVIDTITNNTERQGISASFVRLTGLSGALNARQTLERIADEADGRWPALFYSIGVSLLFVVLASVLLYITGLLVVRAVLMIFLMVTSSLAFAAYLIPQFSNGWGTWWGALLRNAIFAPILMVLLWVDLRVGTALAGGSQGGTFDTLFYQQSNVSGIEILLIYFILIGMLIATAIFANSFSSQIVGFNWASFASTLPFALASRYGLAPLGRATFGRAGAAYKKRLEVARDAATLLPGGEVLAKSLNRSLMRSEKYGIAALAKKDFNLFNVADKFQKKGLTGLLAGKSVVGGYDKLSKERDKRIAAEAGNLVLSQEKAEKQLGTKMKNERGETIEALKDLHKTAQEQLRTTKEEAEKTRGAREMAHKTHADEHKQEVDRMQEMEKAFAVKIEKGDMTKDEAENAEREHKTGMLAQAEKIEKARLKAERSEKLIDNPETVRAAQEKLEGVGNRLNKMASEVEKEAKRAVGRSADTAASYAAEKGGGWLGLVGLNQLEGDSAKAAFRKEFKNRELKEQMKAWKALSEEVGGEAKAKTDSEEKH